MKKVYNSLLIIILISFLLINLNVVYLGDDYYFLHFKQYNLQEYINKLVSFYFTDNGRFITHLLVTLFLKLPLIVWQITNSLMLTGICLLISKILCDNLKQATIILVMSFFLLSSIEIMVTRQSVYWLTGSFNYVYPCMLLLLYSYLLTKIDQKKYFTPSVIVGFLSSATMEQSALMTIVLTILACISKAKRIEREKIIILLLITILGTLSVLLAPSQFSRINIESKDFSLIKGITDNLSFILDFYTKTRTASILGLMFIISSIIFTIKKEEKTFVKISFLLFELTAIFIVIFYNSKLIILIYVIIVFYLNKKIYNKFLSPISIAVALFIVSQLMMVVSPVLGYRNFIFGIVAYIFIIATIINTIEFNKFFFILINSILIILSILLNLHTADGYHKTKAIDQKNIAIINNNSNIISNKDESITLYKYINEDYAWSMPYASDFHLEYYKKYHGIECKINWY